MNRRLPAFALLVAVTAFMWSDLVIDWWQSTLDFFASVNESVTESVLESRPGNDADLHVLVWGLVSVVFAWAFPRRRLAALVGLLAWSAIVETLQPAFTEIRSRQVADYVGNTIGVTVVALAVTVFVRLRRPH